MSSECILKCNIISCQSINQFELNTELAKNNWNEERLFIGGQEPGGARTFDNNNFAYFSAA